MYAQEVRRKEESLVVVMLKLVAAASRDAAKDAKSAFLRFILSTGVRSVRKYWEGQRVDYKCF